MWAWGFVQIKILLCGHWIRCVSFTTLGRSVCLQVFGAHSGFHTFVSWLGLGSESWLMWLVATSLSLFLGRFGVVWKVYLSSHLGRGCMVGGRLGRHCLGPGVRARFSKGWWTSCTALWVMWVCFWRFGSRPRPIRWLGCIRRRIIRAFRKLRCLLQHFGEDGREPFRFCVAHLVNRCRT